jgi:hypothetical protein
MKYKIVPPPLEPVDIVLTRYLYIKEEVMISLILSVLEKNREQSLFWAYELYWSGFQEELFEYLMSFYWETFEPLNPRLRKFLQSQIDSWKTDNSKHYVVGTIIRNLSDQSRSYRIDSFVLKTQPVIDSKIKDHRFYIVMEEKDVKQYETIETEPGELPRFILGKACKYSTRKDCNKIFGSVHRDLSHSEIRHMSTMTWEYYASFSKVWSDRIEEFGGFIDRENRKVVFHDDDIDDFYDRYGYEPDEQPSSLLSKITHLTEEYQMSLYDFAKTYNASLETLNRINNESSDCHQYSSP